MEVSDIIEAIDIEEYLSQYCDFEERGGELWALSPFKEENTPSFSVRVETGYWYDFSIGSGGNLIDFVMKKHCVSVPEAVRILKKYAGIKDDGRNPSQKLSAVKIARKYRQSSKPLKASVAKPLPDDIMSKYEFRRNKLKLWEDEGISIKAMREYGVMYDALDNRIVYPIRDYDGRIISVCGRTCDPDYKKKKLRKYTYYGAMGTIDTLCCYAENKKAIFERKEIILFEGFKSCLKAWDWGIPNTAALLTSHLSPIQLRFLIKLSCLHGIRIVFALDSDVDITKDENIMRLKSFANIEWISNAYGLLEPKDAPVDQGEEVFRKLYEMRSSVR